jgi:hypothetical protein
MFDLLMINVEGNPSIQAGMDAVVGTRTAIHIRPGAARELYSVSNADALVLQHMTAGDIFGVHSSHAYGWLVVDDQTDARVLMEIPSIAHPHPASQSRTTATWIVMVPDYAGSELIVEASQALTAAHQRGTRFLQDLHERHLWYPRMLSAFEAIEWHNSAGREAAITLVATWADLQVLPGILRAYDVCERRALAGVYTSSHPAWLGSGL